MASHPTSLSSSGTFFVTFLFGHLIFFDVLGLLDCPRAKAKLQDPRNTKAELESPGPFASQCVMSTLQPLIFTGTWSSEAW